MRSAGQKLHEEARRLAQTQGIDLPGAYSVLLGVMPLEEVLEFGNGGPAEAVPLEKTPAAALKQEVLYDPAFAQAVEAGLLSARQAMERGKRDAYAGIVANRHGLSTELALAVADNRTSLLQALRQREAGKLDTLRVTVRAGLPGPAKWVALATLPLLLVALVYAKWDGSAPSTVVVARPVQGGAILTDTAGRLIQVSGLNPRSVLRAYCASAVAGHPYEAVDLVPSPQPGVRARIGLLRDPASPSTLLAITIREDEAAGLWVAGDGRSPLVASEAPGGIEVAVGESDAQAPDTGAAATAKKGSKRQSPASRAQRRGRSGPDRAENP